MSKKSIGVIAGAVVAALVVILGVVLFASRDSASYKYGQEVGRTLAESVLSEPGGNTDFNSVIIKKYCRAGSYLKVVDGEPIDLEEAYEGCADALAEELGIE